VRTSSASFGIASFGPASLGIALLATAACGGSSTAQADPATAAAAGSAPASSAASTEAPAATTADAPSAAPSDAPSAAAAFPTACADKAAEACTPPGDYVERLCARPHQAVALALFGKTPFTRLYLRGKMDELVFDEEVLALRYHALPKGGIQVGNSKGSYDVLRWDGTCSRAVDVEMLTKTRPPHPRAAKVQWHRLADKTQTALITASDAVKKAHAKRGKECKGAMSGDVSATCEKADAALVDAIVEYVRGGGDVPTPDGM
jgi:hypothetical protein